MKEIRAKNRKSQPRAALTLGIALVLCMSLFASHLDGAEANADASPEKKPYDNFQKVFPATDILPQIEVLNLPQSMPLFQKEMEKHAHEVYPFSVILLEQNQPYLTAPRGIPMLPGGVSFSPKNAIYHENGKEILWTRVEKPGHPFIQVDETPRNAYQYYEIPEAELRGKTLISFGYSTRIERVNGLPATHLANFSCAFFDPAPNLSLKPANTMVPILLKSYSPNVSNGRYEPVKLLLTDKNPKEVYREILFAYTRAQLKEIQEKGLDNQRSHLISTAFAQMRDILYLFEDWDSYLKLSQVYLDGGFPMLRVPLEQRSTRTLEMLASALRVMQKPDTELLKHYENLFFAILAPMNQNGRETNGLVRQIHGRLLGHYYEQGALDGVKEYVKRVAEKNCLIPGMPEAIECLGYMEAGDLDAAQKLLTREQDKIRSPKTPYYQYLGQVQSLLNNPGNTLQPDRFQNDWDMIPNMRIAKTMELSGTASELHQFLRRTLDLKRTALRSVEEDVYYTGVSSEYRKAFDGFQKDYDAYLNGYIDILKRELKYSDSHAKRRMQSLMIGEITPDTDRSSPPKTVLHAIPDAIERGESQCFFRMNFRYTDYQPLKGRNQRGQEILYPPGDVTELEDVTYVCGMNEVAAIRENTVLWRTKVNSDPGFLFRGLSQYQKTGVMAPSVSGDMVVVRMLLPPNMALAGLNRHTGKIKWMLYAEAPDRLDEKSLPAILADSSKVRDPVLFGQPVAWKDRIVALRMGRSADSALQNQHMRPHYAMLCVIDPETGEMDAETGLFHIPVFTDMSMSRRTLFPMEPILDGDSAIVSNDAGLVARVNLERSSLEWVRRTPQKMPYFYPHLRHLMEFSSPGVQLDNRIREEVVFSYGPHLYVSAKNGDQLLRLDRKTGKLDGTVPLPPFVSQLFPLPQENRILILFHNKGEVYSIQPWKKIGERKIHEDWSLQTRLSEGGRIVFRDGASNLYEFDPDLNLKRTMEFSPEFVPVSAGRNAIYGMMNLPYNSEIRRISTVKTPPPTGNVGEGLAFMEFDELETIQNRFNAVEFLQANPMYLLNQLDSGTVMLFSFKENRFALFPASNGVNGDWIGKTVMFTTDDRGRIYCNSLVSGHVEIIHPRDNSPSSQYYPRQPGAIVEDDVLYFATLRGPRMILASLDAKNGYRELYSDTNTGNLLAISQKGAKILRGERKRIDNKTERNVAGFYTYNPSKATYEAQGGEIQMEPNFAWHDYRVSAISGPLRALARERGNKGVLLADFSNGTIREIQLRQPQNHSEKIALEFVGNRFLYVKFTNDKQLVRYQVYRLDTNEWIPFESNVRPYLVGNSILGTKSASIRNFNRYFTHPEFVGYDLDRKAELPKKENKDQAFYSLGVIDYVGGLVADGKLYEFLASDQVWRGDLACPSMLFERTAQNELKAVKIPTITGARFTYFLDNHLILGTRGQSIARIPFDRIRNLVRSDGKLAAQSMEVPREETKNKQETDFPFLPDGFDTEWNMKKDVPVGKNAYQVRILNGTLYFCVRIRDREALRNMDAKNGKLYMNIFPGQSSSLMRGFLSRQAIRLEIRNPHLSPQWTWIGQLGVASWNPIDGSLFVEGAAPAQALISKLAPADVRDRYGDISFELEYVPPGSNDYLMTNLISGEELPAFFPRFRVGPVQKK